MLPSAVRLSTTAIVRHQFLPLKSAIIATRSPAVTFHRGMATASRVQLSLNDCGEFHLPDITAESAAKGSEVLQENHENYHVFFNRAGFHSMCLSVDINMYTLHSPRMFDSYGSTTKVFGKRLALPLTPSLLKPLLCRQSEMS